MKPIYLDYAATTPVDPRVAAVMQAHLTIDGIFGNPSSTNHRFGRQADDAVATARRQVAALINAHPAQIVWTSGATESNNLALKGAAHTLRSHGTHVLTCATEHPAVLDVCTRLEEEGFAVTRLQPRTNGLIDIQQLESAINAKTILISIMHVNNEIGVIQDLEAIGRLAKKHGAVFHVDAAQSAGKIPIDVEKSQIDLLSLNAHKVYGPMGIGALYVRDAGLIQEPLIHGGGQERGLRSGTLPTHQIVGMGESFRIAGEQMREEQARTRSLRSMLWEGLQQIPSSWLNGDYGNSVAGILNVGFADVDGEGLLLELDHIALSTGAACSSSHQEPSHVLRGLGLADEKIANTVRFSLGRYTSEDEIAYVVEALKRTVNSMRCA